MDAPNQTPRERVAQTVLAYYQLLDARPATAVELASWVDGLAATDQATVTRIGLRQALLLPAFRRYVLEIRGVSMPAYMLAQLAP